MDLLNEFGFSQRSCWKLIFWLQDPVFLLSSFSSSQITPSFNWERTDTGRPTPQDACHDMAAGEYLLNPIPMYGKYAASWCFRGGWVKSCSWFCLPCINHPRELCTNQQTQNATIVFNIFFFQVPAVRFFFLGEIDHLTCFKPHNLASTVAVVCESNTQEIVSFHINWWANEIKWDQMSTCLGFKQKPIERFIYHSNLQPFLCDTRGARNGRKLNLISFETLSFKSCVSDASEEGQRTTRTSRISSIDPFNIMVVELLELQRLFQPISYVTEDGKFATPFFLGMYIYIFRERERYLPWLCMQMFGRHLRSAHEQFTIRKGKVVFSASFPRWNYAYGGKTKSLCHERPWQVPWAK